MFRTLTTYDIYISHSKYRFLLKNFKLHRSTSVYGCTYFNLTANYLFYNFILNYMINNRNLRYLGTICRLITTHTNGITGFFTSFREHKIPEYDLLSVMQIGNIRL